MNSRAVAAAARLSISLAISLSIGLAIGLAAGASSAATAPAARKPQSPRAAQPSGPLLAPGDEASDESEEDAALPLLDDGVSPDDDTMMGQGPEASPAAGLNEKPPAEFPYPGARERAFRPPIPVDAVVPARPNPALPRPKAIGENGEYFFDVDEPTSPATAAKNPNLPRPERTNRAGEYDYGSAGAPTAPRNPIPGLERPVEISASGYYYDIERSSQRGSWSMRMGFMSPPTIKNAKTGASYKDIYGEYPQGALFLDYEWRFLRSLGHMGLKVGSGLMLGTGKGRFSDPTIESQWRGRAEEQFTFFLFPNTAALTYRFQYSNKQILIPFVEGGAGYYAFVEARDDDKTPKLGGAPVAVGAGGLLIGLDFLDRAAIRQLDAEYGINHVYLALEGRAVAGLHPTYNFTSLIANAGIVADF